MTQHTDRVHRSLGHKSRVFWAHGSRVQASGFHRSSLACQKSTGTVENRHWNRRSSALCTTRWVTGFGSRLSLDLSVSVYSLSTCVKKGKREMGRGCCDVRENRDEKERKRKKREKVRGSDVRERREERKKIGDTWRAASGWKGMMKSLSANRAMTHGKREIRDSRLGLIRELSSFSRLGLI
jgi:hypothetical protein